MRRKLVLGVGLAMFGGGAALGQFAVDRVPPVGAPKAATPAPLPGGLQPATPGRAAPLPGGFVPATPATPGPVTPAGGAYVPPVGAVQPASYATLPGGPTAGMPPGPLNIEIPSALGKDHPWAIKPEHGPYFILVKSYVRPAKGSQDAKDDGGLTARELAEGLASEIRDTYRVQAFLYEYISEEQKAEMRAVEAARQRARTAYVAQLDAIKQKAQLQGMEFLAPDNKLHIMKHHHRDQIGVLVGGFQTEADAIKALAVLKKWPAPKNEVLMDKGAIARPDANGKKEIVYAAINPYANAFVVPNPAAARPEQQRHKLDPFVVKLNEDNPYSLLKATKGWTLSVKSFASPVEVVGNKDPDTSVMRKMGFNKDKNVLAAGAEQAEALAKAIRQMRGPGANGQPGPLLGLEAFVLHTRTASLVTVGQFDGPDDPALHATMRLLGSIKFNATEDPHGTRAVANTPAVFGNLLPMPIPKP